MKLKVECYSGRKADERPVRFWLDGRLYRVEDVLDQWYDPEHIFYKVQANDGNLYILRQQTSTADGQWDLISFRQHMPNPIKALRREVHRRRPDPEA